MRKITEEAGRKGGNGEHTKKHKTWKVMNGKRDDWRKSSADG